MVGSERHLIDQVLWLHDQLAAAESLAPGPRIDALFDELVAIAKQPAEDFAHILWDERVRKVLPGLHELYARGGYAREEYWARRIIGASDPAAELANFPFLENYRLLAAMEHRALTELLGSRVDRVAFAGSGPLPLTSILLAREFGIRSRNIDVCPHAIATAKELVERLGVTGLEFECRDVTDCAFVEGEVLMLAASVGLGEGDKGRVINSLHRQLPTGALLLARSVEGLKALLYPRLEFGDLVGFAPITAAHPLHYVVNSVIIARNQAPIPDLADETRGRVGVAVATR